ncbi:ATP-dependent RecD-like DNA helicase [Candidatus Gracilibacteria bacterium]|nr:ATP-dependent RecD-like DNA helicase [Candidatus Gracilibacteria bacterium]
MATLLEKIDVINGKINKNISILANKERGLASQAILDDLRDLVEHTAVLIYAGKDAEIGFDLIGESLEHIRQFSKYSFLYKFHSRLNSGISHYEPNESDAEMLILGYMHNLFLIKKFYIETYKYQILQELKNYPLNLDPGLSAYYNAIIEKIKTADYEKNIDKGDFYIDRVKPLIIDNELYYEVTFRPAINNFAKFNKTVAYTQHKIETNYALRLFLAKTQINVFDTKSRVLIILDFEISIRPCEIEHLGMIFDRNFKFNGRGKEYQNLMEGLKMSQLTLLEVARLNDERFEKFKNYLNDDSRSGKILLVIEKCRQVINKNESGSNVLSYLLTNLNNVVLKNQLSTQKCNMLSNMYLQNGCKVFDDMPFCSSLKYHNPTRISLIDCISSKDRKYEFLARRVNQNTRTKKILYTPIEEVEKDYDVDKEINAFNSKVWRGHKPDRELRTYSKYIYNHGADKNCYEIFTKIVSLTNSGIKDYQTLIDLWLGQQEDIDSDQKKRILRELFAKSRVSLIYGSAGTGKTKMIEYINNIFHTENKVFLSNTHASVNNLKIRIGESDKHTFSTVASYLSNIEEYVDSEILFIDECSTVSNDDLLGVLSHGKFKKIVLVGDVYQIEAIDFGNWFYLCKNLLPKHCIFELDDTHRTKKEDLKLYWTAIRNSEDNVREIASRGHFTKPVDQFIKNYEDSEDQIVLCLNYDGLYGINNLNKLLQEKNPNIAIDWGVHSYKIGDPIIFTESSRFGPVLYNNLKGRISEITTSDNEIIFEIIIPYSVNPFDAHRYGVELLENLPDDKSKIRFSVNRLQNVDEDLDDSERMVPFQVSYATSIHKAQGLEYKAVKLIFVDEVQDMVTHSIFYTAITRAKEKLEIYWSPETADKVYERIKTNLNKQDSNIFKGKFKL